MKILAIRTKNLASLDGVNEIDFTIKPLQSAGIFAITGTTGSGKSTILDALCLALYAETPRYKVARRGVEVADVKDYTIPQNDPRRVLRVGAGDGFAEVDFVSIEGEAYRSKWSVRRAHYKADGALQPYDMSLIKIADNQPVQGRKTELLEKIIQLTGLTFEQFTRSVLLAQGDFTAFLKAEKDEKASLLEKLTGTYIYSDISKQVFENYKNEKLKLDNLNSLRGGIYTLTDDELSDRYKQLNRIDNELYETNKNRENLLNEKNWHSRLSELMKMADTTEQKFKTAVENKSNAISREEKLREVIQIQSVKPLIDELNRVQVDFSTTTNKSEDIQKNLYSLTQVHKEAVEREQCAINELDKKRSDESEAKPLLDSAKSFDVQLSEIRKQKDLIETAEKVAKIKYDNQLNELNNKKTELEDINKTLKEITNWLKENETRKSLGEGKNLVIKELSDSEQFLTLYNESNKNRANTKEKLQKLNIRHSELKTKVETLSITINRQKIDLTAQKKQIDAIKIQDLENERNDVDQLYETLVLASAHWKNLFSATHAFNSLLNNYQVNNENLQAVKSNFLIAKKILNEQKIAKESAQKMLDRARLATAKNVKTLRAELVQNEPCPVCGSTEHPYTEESSELSNVLHSLETMYHDTEIVYEKQLSTFTSLEAELKTLQKTTTILTEQIPIKEMELKGLDKEWKEFSIYNRAKDIDLDKRTEWFEKEKSTLKTRQSRLHEQISAYYTQKKDFDTAQEKLQRNLDNLGTIVLEIQSVEGLISTEKTKFEHYDNELSLAQINLDKAKERLSTFFPSEIWFEKWQENPKVFEEKIIQFADLWKGKTEQFVEYERLLGMVGATVEVLEKHVETLQNDAIDKSNDFNRIADEWKQISEKRKSIFGGKPVHIVETELKTAIGIAEKELKECEVEVNNCEKKLTEAEIQLKQTKADINTFERVLTQCKEKLNDWILQYNARYNSQLSDKRLSELLPFDQSWIEDERKLLQKLTDDVNLTKSAFNERTKDVALHVEQRISEKELPEVLSLLAEVETVMSDLQKKSGEINAEIKENEKKHSQIANLLERIEQQRVIMDDWAKLNELIGSADGKKFRQIAQEYTLDILLSYANVHLKTLNPRYLLERTFATLGLQIKDLDMGNEVRTVYSLSGGESFLVSLALALGLASLSSNRIKVETLFIDEGFGSLDIDTLNIAMDALERLHNQGRKVGVISHVQEMSERISTQIHVSKQRNGRSKVEVINR